MGKYVEQYRRAEEQHYRLQQRIEEQYRRIVHRLSVTRRDFLGQRLLSGIGIDGNRSIVEMRKLLAQQYQIPEESACAAVRQILIDNYQKLVN